MREVRGGKSIRVIRTLAVLGLSTLVPVLVMALPFNDDMVHDQLKTNEVMRDAPEQSVPIGSSGRFVKDRAAALNLKNPIDASVSSVENGKRLWEVNCVPCHGRYTGKSAPGFPDTAVFERPINPAISGPTMGPPLVTKSYINDPAKTDGHLFGYIHFGGLAIMPRYGYKLSPREHWDIVNYIRDMQRDFSENVLKQVESGSKEAE